MPALEGEDHEEPVDIALNALDAAFSRGPDLRGDIIEGAQAVFVGPACDLHVESGVVDEDHDVGGESRDVVLTLAHLAADGPQVAEDLHDAEERRFAVVFS